MSACSLTAWVRAVALCLLLTGCAGWHREVPREPSYAFDLPESTELAARFRPQLADRPGDSGVHLLASGTEAFQTRAVLADLAERTLDLQYYYIADDATATLLLQRTLRAATRGVRVRILVDGWYSDRREPELSALATHPNVQVRIFNPFRMRANWPLARVLEFLGDGNRLHRRMHNKLWVSDNAAAVIGGRNLGDIYFDAHGEEDFADLDLLAVGPVVRDISRSFDEYWNSEWAVPIRALVGGEEGDHVPVAARLEQHAAQFRETEYARALRAAGYGRAIRTGALTLLPGRAVALFDRPQKLRPDHEGERSAVSAVQRKLVREAQREVLLISPYFVPTDRGVQVLTDLVRRGVRVRVLTNSLASTDVPVVHAGYARYREKMLAGGIELYERRPQPGPPPRGRTLSSGNSLHAKAAVIDRRHVIIGSMNLDPRSRLWNTESALLVESEVLGEQVAELFHDAVAPESAFRVERAPEGPGEGRLRWLTVENGAQAAYEREPLTSWWRRFVSTFLGLLAPEELL